jgi:hypothetical protein
MSSVRHLALMKKQSQTMQHSYATEDEELGKLLAQLRGKVTQDTREGGTNHG